MGKGGRGVDSAQPVYTWDDIRQHDTTSDKWIVINDNVYDITEWAKRHPGGFRIISHYAGQDASVSYQFTLKSTLHLCGLFLCVYSNCIYDIFFINLIDLDNVQL